MSIRSLILLTTTIAVLHPAEGLGRSKQETVFRFSLSTEPSNIDPAKISSSESNYFIVNLLRGLYVMDKSGNPKPEIAERCTVQASKTIVTCKIRKGAKWSNGNAITASDFVYSWRRIVAPGSKGVGVAILTSLENASEVYAGKSPVEKLGVQAVDERTLEIRLSEPDPDFFSRLTHPALSVVHRGYEYNRESAPSVPYSGPYQVVEWTKGNRVRIESNAQFDTVRANGHRHRPAVEILVIDDDETALNLYREGTLTFLRRLPTHYLKDWKNSKELFQVPVVRFDYVGFSERLRGETDFRKALVHALNYKELQTLYSALGIPGCPGIDPTWMTRVPCHEFNLEKAKKLWESVSEDVKKKPLVLRFSKLGGDDIQKGMEWIQAQWKKHLGYSVELRSTENSVYVSELAQGIPDIFRKGVGLDRATCLAAVEIFKKGDSENYIRLDDPTFEGLVFGLQTATEAKKKSACTAAVERLISNAEIIPLGRIHFSLLAKQSFKGWVLTPLNQLDLAELRVSP